MSHDLSDPEVRVLGCLLEKQRMTPDAYPLTLNALRAACNQSTNRDPVVQYDESVLRDALARLGHRRWTRLASYHGSRASKYRHLLDEALGIRPDEQAVLAVLMLRGPQTVAELRANTDRMHRFADASAVEGYLHELAAREAGALVTELPRAPGSREARWMHLLSGPPEASATALAERASSPTGSEPLADRLAALEAEVERLRAEVAALADALRGQAAT